MGGHGRQSTEVAGGEANLDGYVPAVDVAEVVQSVPEGDPAAEGPAAGAGDSMPMWNGFPGCCAGADRGAPPNVTTAVKHAAQRFIR